jgi:hypothetical protein
MYVVVVITGILLLLIVQNSEPISTNFGLGGHIGDINCCAPTCADDVALVSNNPLELQMLIDIVVNYSKREGYTLQPTKSVILPVKSPKLVDMGSEFKIYIEMSAILFGRLNSCFSNFLKYICRHSIFFPDGKTISRPKFIPTKCFEYVQIIL